MNNDPINKHVEDTLNSLDGVTRATPSPYLLTRINARLSATTVSVWDNISSFVSRPVTLAIGLGLILVLNATAILQNKSTGRTSDDQLTVTVPDDYSAGFTMIDNLENNEP